VLGVLGRMPLGLGIVDFLGHMDPDERLRVPLAGSTLAGPIGLGALVDPEARATSALTRFGVGFIELGPVASTSSGAARGWHVELQGRALRASPAPSVDAHALAERLAHTRLPPEHQAWVRIAAAEPTPEAVISVLHAHASAFLLEAGDAAALDARVHAAVVAAGGTRPILLSMAANEAHASELGEAAMRAGAVGVFVRGERVLDNGECELGAAVADLVLERVRELRVLLPASAVIVAGGVLEPDDARVLLSAGATLVAVDAGLVLAGPGLVKRCNEALLSQLPEPTQALEPIAFRSARSAWFWSLLLGCAMFFGGLLALGIASTRVVLPYDEALCGMTRSQLAALNPQLLPFMAHDRVTLAGTMLSIGILYSALALHGVRRGQHWAQVAVAVSAISGFLSFFSFLGFGYFDPFHAFVAAVLLQLVLLSMFGAPSPARPLASIEWHETPAFRKAVWGQLLLVVMGAGLIGAGLLITAIGCTDVFVREDLEFLRTSAAELFVAHERLVPLVAHDRASLGGMLLANGLVVMLTTLWGFRAGARWLWTAFAWAGSVAFAAAVGVHYAVGYTSTFHLLPAFIGLGLWWLALTLTRSWLCPTNAST
jgi:dihydroorotate dehydrogenase